MNSGSEDDKLKVLVLDLKSAEYKITPDVWIQTEGEIQDIMCEYYEDAASLGFLGAGWHRSGHRMVACADNFTVLWLMNIIENLPKSNELERKAILIENLEDYSVRRGWICIPPPAKPTETVLSLITNQNPWLNTTGWSVSYKDEDFPENKGDSKKPGFYYLQMTEASIPALQEKDFIIKYSFGKAIINLCDSSPL